ncbi:MAG: hypothetical protein GY866_37110, partial [Proteobacteria bacterium]|nr:hypothetical protein [Pseudomonadota bacterium]
MKSKIPNLKSKILFLFLLFIVEGSLWGVDYRWTDHTGTRIYSCDRFCGKVRVKEIERNIYMVYSINFTGKV